VKPPSSWGEFCCCMAAGSLLLTYLLVYCWICSNCQPPRWELTSQQYPSRCAGGGSKTLHAQSPHRPSP
jgi:hypothetical protein